jgi:hypothetical protein
VPKALARPLAKTIKTTKIKTSDTLGMTYAAFALPFRLAAQYFFIRRLTAFLAAADIFERLRTGLAPFVFARRPGPRWGIDGLTALPISRDEIAF